MPGPVPHRNSADPKLLCGTFFSFLFSDFLIYGYGYRYGELSAALARVLDDYSLVKFFPLDITSEENIQVAIICIHSQK
jgi:hypothetical protein